MIVGLCGTHGTGKSTILHAAKEAGFQVSEAQLSRTAQKALGWETLARAQESEENMWALQDAIAMAMYDRDQEIIKSGKLTLVERTPADVWAYTNLWVSRLRMSGKKVDEARLERYKNICRVQASRYAKYIVVEPCAEIAFVEEPNRADAESRKLVQDYINAFLWDGMLPSYFIKSTDRLGRSSEIQCLLTLVEVENKAKAFL